jgi:hypothetical protein
VVRSTQPLAGLLYEVGPVRQVCIVSADLRSRPYELWVLSLPTVVVMLDVVTGEVWTRERAEQEFGLPVVLLPELEAIVGAEAGEKTLLRVAHLMKHRGAIAAALATGDSPERAEVPRSIGEAIGANLEALHALAHKLRGHGNSDPGAQAVVSKLLNPTLLPVASTTATTAYVIAEVDTTADPLLFKACAVLAPGLSAHVRGHAEALALLRTVHGAAPKRWFLPHALDVLGCLADHDAPMPTSAIDPAHVLFVLDPDEPVAVDRLYKPAQAFPRDLLAWLGDAKRKVDQPAGSLGYVGILPELDTRLLDARAQRRLKKLMEEDIGPTVPVLARIERRGAWVRLPHSYIDWEEYEHATQSIIQQHELVFLPILGSIDVYASSVAAPVAVFRRTCPLTSEELDACAGHPEDELARMAEKGFKPARALLAARRLDHMARVWLKPLCSGASRLRGRQMPTTTGRWVTGRYNLQGLTKGGFVTGRLRTAMGAPPGYVLVVADYSAFEGRILGALSGDPLLLLASKGKDFHEVMAQAVFGRSDKTTLKQWKTALYGIAYGQGRRGFIRTHPEFSVDLASSAYNTVQAKLKKAMKYQRDVRADFVPRKSQTVTRGGWRRRAPRWTQAFNTLLQGSAADIFRWCLRRLDQALAPLGAFIVHQCHDEVFVATLPERAEDVQHVVRHVMEQEVLSAGLLPPGVPLFVKMKVRQAWADP